MKKIITMLFLLAISLSLNSKAFAQANSVGLNGSFVYNSISAAYTAIGGTISSAQLIELSSSYNGSSEVPPIILGAKTGSSPANSITIRPSAGANGLILSGALNNGVIRFDGCNYVFLDGRPGGINSTPANYLTINNTLSTAPFNSAHAVLFGSTVGCKVGYLNANCVLSDLGARGVISIGGSVIVTTGSGNVIANNVIKGGARAIQIGGGAGSVHNNDTIRNNDVSQYSILGIFTNFTNGAVVSKNRVHFTSAITTTAAFLVGMQIQGNFTLVDQNEIDNLQSLNSHSLLHMANFGASNTITRNKIHDATSGATQTNVITGIQFSSSGNTVFSENEIYNLNSGGTGSSIFAIFATNNGAATDTTNIVKNKISNLSTTVNSDIYGILLQPRNGNSVNVIENNISISGASNSSTGIFGIYSTFSTVAPTTLDYTANVRKNSIYIGGTNLGTVGTFINSAGIARDNNGPLSVYTQKNNNVVNERITGDANFQFHIAFWLDTLTGTRSIDSNRYYATDPNGGFAALWYDSLFENSDIIPYRAYAAPSEASTTFGNVNFLKLTMNFEACPTQSPVIVELRNATSPYALVESVDGIAGGATQKVIKFDNASDGIPYYIVVKSINMLETWSATTLTFNSNGASYDFTTSRSQAYGSNQALSGGIASVYQGDVNQDGAIDLTDLTLTYNDASTFNTSPATDFNCDGTTDLTDIVLVSNNGRSFISVQRPPVLDGQVTVNNDVSKKAVKPNSMRAPLLNQRVEKSINSMEIMER